MHADAAPLNLDFLPLWGICWFISCASGLVRVALSPPRRAGWKRLAAEVAVGNVLTFTSLGMIEHHMPGAGAGYYFSSSFVLSLFSVELMEFAKGSFGKLLDAVLYRIRGGPGAPPPDAPEPGPEDGPR